MKAIERKETPQERYEKTHVERLTLKLNKRTDADILAALEGKAKFGFWEKFDDTHTVLRIATSWATRMEEIEQLIALM